MNWQPIETAPKDGTRILCRDKDGEIEIAKWSKMVNGWSTHHCGCGCTIDAIEWQALPT